MKRRQFIEKLGLITGSVSFSLSGIPVRSFANPLLRTESEGNILVFIQLAGGNDTLNTLVPFDNDIYYRNRPVLSIPKSNVIPITPTLGFNSQMPGFSSLFKEGKMCIVQNTGYENPERSHFKAIDIWQSASDPESVRENGWAARYLSALPESLLDQRRYPMAVELGWSGSLLVEEPTHSHALYMNSLDEYLTITKQYIEPLDQHGLSVADLEADYINYIAIQSNRYAARMNEVALAGHNSTSYPDSFLGRQLAIISKLISGGLETSVYIAKLNGFDTHIIQAEPHAALLKEVSEAVTAFQKDLEGLGISQRVTTMVYTEFSRRLKEGGLGTDHGAATPIYVIGESVRAGIIGSDPDLENLDDNGDLQYKFDYRQIYSTILQDHIGSGSQAAFNVLGSDYPTMPIYKNSIEPYDSYVYQFDSVYPNPTSTGTITVVMKFTEKVVVALDVFSTNGQRIANYFHKIFLSGTHSVPLDISRLSEGSYFIILNVNGEFISKPFMKV